MDNKIPTSPLCDGGEKLHRILMLGRAEIRCLDLHGCRINRRSCVALNEIWKVRRRLRLPDFGVACRIELYGKGKRVVIRTHQ